MSAASAILPPRFREAGTLLPRQDYRVELRYAALCYDVFPVPLEAVSGTLDIHLAPAGDAAGHLFEFRNIRANRGTVSRRRARPPPVRRRPGRKSNSKFTATGSRSMNRSAVHSLACGCAAIWDMFAPCGRMDFDADYSHRDNPNGPPEFTLTMTPRGATIRPSFFPYTLTDLCGSFRATRTRVDLENFAARHGDTQVKVAGGSIVMASGGYRADLGGIVAAPLPMDEDLGRACPACAANRHPHAPAARHVGRRGSAIGHR